ncbi:hypothetical protein EC957_000291 [Mortierella hygrophila]|uniref:Uncharacterized protein n=1 Tax=Mortierella hygrophila TaxID=979708 RepID=A0A9P6F7Z7_9FUNG|nr:hypothetical protein EC957_000291 [Mortierella hygrophila]
MPQTSNKKRSGVTMVRGEPVGVKEGLDSDETVAEGLKATKSMGIANDDKIVAGDIVNDEDEDDCEECIEGSIQERQELKDESEVVARKGRGQEERSPCHGPASIADDDEYPQGTTPPICSPRHLLGSDLPFTDPADMKFADQEDPRSSRVS